MKNKLFMIIIAGIILCLTISCSQSGKHQETPVSKPDAATTETPLPEKSPDMPAIGAASPNLSESPGEYEIREVDFDGGKIYLPAKLPKDKFQNINTKRQKELAEAEGIYINQRRWEAEAKVVLEEMQKYDCIKPGYKIADLGGGTGYYSMIFSQIVGKSGLIYLLDVDINLLDNAIQIINYNIQSAKKSNIRLFYSNIIPILSCPESTLLEDESVDTVFMCDIHIFHLFPDDKKHQFKNMENPEKIHELMAKTTSIEQSQIIKNIFDILKPDGNLIITEKIYSSDTALKNDRSGIQRIFEECGFKMIADIRRLDSKEKQFHFLIFRKRDMGNKPNDAGGTAK